MTDSNGDLVEKVARVLWGNASFGGAFEDADVDDKDALRSEASAVIATVLDDLTNPSDAIIAAANRVADEAWDTPDLYLVWLEMLDAKRKELGLSSPVEPGDAARTA